jgi:hypothetical protein
MLIKPLSYFWNEALRNACLTLSRKERVRVFLLITPQCGKIVPTETSKSGSTSERATSPIQYWPINTYAACSRIYTSIVRARVSTIQYSATPAPCYTCIFSHRLYSQLLGDRISTSRSGAASTMPHRQSLTVLYGQDDVGLQRHRLVR